ncbi:MAG: Gfo/Idh/MocA family oxidoreductase, partial [Burkholderiales bacterium]
MRQKNVKRIGLAIVGAGRVGLMRGEIAARFPSVDWIGIAEIDPARGRLVADKLNADFVTTDYRELLKRSEVTAVVISTVGHLHAHPTLLALENPNKPAL